MTNEQLAQVTEESRRHFLPLLKQLGVSKPYIVAKPTYKTKPPGEAKWVFNIWKKELTKGDHYLELTHFDGSFHHPKERKLFLLDKETFQKLSQTSDKDSVVISVDELKPVTFPLDGSSFLATAYKDVPIAPRLVPQITKDLILDAPLGNVTLRDLICAIHLAPLSINASVNAFIRHVSTHSSA